MSLIGVNVAERLMYLPSAFFLVAVALLVSRVPRRVLVPAASIRPLRARNSRCQGVQGVWLKSPATITGVDGSSIAARAAT